MRCFVDLHMHSCLSPCGDELMTPNNIVNMARVKGLDLIAVSDHNSAKNLPAIDNAARMAGIALLPAIELTTREEAHLLSYFRTVEAACAFSDAIYPRLPNIKNRPELFGEQWILDENDEQIGIEPKLLISALDIPLEKLVAMIREAGGLPVPAHINRGANGILNVLGFLPPVEFAALEVTEGMPCPPLPPHSIRLRSSDAHRLEDIFERVEAIELIEPSAEGVFAYLARM